MYKLILRFLSLRKQQVEKKQSVFKKTSAVASGLNPVCSRIQSNPIGLVVTQFKKLSVLNTIEKYGVLLTR